MALLTLYLSLTSLTLVGTLFWAAQGKGEHPLRAGVARQVVPLFAGLLGGFALITVPTLVVIAGLLAAVVILAIAGWARRSRFADAGLLLVGFGITWSSILAWHAMIELPDPHIDLLPEGGSFTGTGLAVLAAGLAFVAAEVVQRRLRR